MRCECGATLDVPTLHRLRELPRAEVVPDGKPSRRWENRHRVTFVLVLLALCSAATAGYLAWILPPAFAQPTAEQFDAAIGTAIEDGGVEQTYAAYQGLQKKGLAEAPLQLSHEDRRTVYHRKWMIWGISAAVGLAICELVAALLVWPRAARQKR